ncbi:Chitinase domain-containing protein 1 [Oopsacas minuta]|uniref:Chitinase domain-containing protein 1 n=1 Tax=Oopsacas minuta TaxID=111878 RepID=A0AAV7JJT7_9METZ|nr:Chitinase domain-containing protein 1 [Oopsacas minuta]
MASLWCYLAVLLLLSSLLTLTNQTLSRSDRKKPVPKDSCTPGDPLCDKSADTPVTLDATVIDRNLVREDVKYTDVLRNHKTYSHVHAKIRFVSMETTLVFVTPWNSKGYELALTFSHKFTHISPVWFQLSPSGDISGKHDIKEKWLRKLYKSNPDLKVIPRFLFDGWSADDFDTFYGSEDRMNKMVDGVIHLLTHYKMHGAVLEIWRQMPSEYFYKFMGFLQILSDRFEEKDLYLCMVVPPSNPDPEAIDPAPYNSTHFLATNPLLDSVLIMTYDYPSLIQRPGPSSPLPWIEGCVYELSPNYELRHKILIGVNLFGNEFSRQGHVPLDGNLYLDKLRQLKPAIEWNEQSGEHIIQIDSPTDPRLIVYPSLNSIQTRIRLAERLSVGIGMWELGQGLDYFYDLF